MLCCVWRKLSKKSNQAQEHQHMDTENEDSEIQEDFGDAAMDENQNEFSDEEVQSQDDEEEETDNIEQDSDSQLNSVTAKFFDGPANDY